MDNIIQSKGLLMSKYRMIVLCLMSLSIIDSYAMHRVTAHSSTSVNLNPAANVNLLEQNVELARDADLYVKIFLSAIPLIPEGSQRNEIINFVQRLQSCFSEAAPNVSRLCNVLQDGENISNIMDKLDKRPSPTDERIYNIARSALIERIIDQEDEHQDPSSLDKDLRELKKRSNEHIEALQILYTKKSDEFHKCMIRDHLITIKNYQNCPQRLRKILDTSSKLRSYLNGEFLKPEVANCYKYLQSRLSGKFSDINGLRNALRDCNDVCDVMNKLDKNPSLIGEEDGNIVKSTLIAWMRDREDERQTIPDSSDPVYASHLDDKSFGNQRVPDSNDPIYFPNPDKDFRELRDRSVRQENALLALYANESSPFHKRMIGSHLSAIQGYQNRPQKLHEALDMASRLQSYLEGEKEIVLRDNNR
ncbi:hypothetical protein KJZ61_00070 [Candidatus Dependentiae bacterium]|nr:hypothetical protein [Candidatus Dependentiae bacterium]